MSCGSSSSVTNNGQMSLEQQKAESVASDNEKKVKERLEYLRYVLPNTSPISIPETATIRDEHKKNGYDQVQYQWQDGEYKYTSRWHTHTPGAPVYSQETWVVERRIPGIGAGKNHRPQVREVLVGDNKWIDWGTWHDAVKAHRLGNETKEQRELLDNRHWKA